MPTEEDLRIKGEFIRGFFDAVDERIAFVRELEREAHSTEARLLCCCYIDGFANNLLVSGPGAPRFVRVLWDHGQDPYFRLISPTALLRSLPRRSATEKLLVSEVERLFGEAPPEFFLESDLQGRLATELSEEVLGRFEHEAWRGTMAGIAYWHYRSQFVHELGGPSSLTFSATHDGAPVADLTLERLLAALERIAAYARELSVASNEWFGQSLSPSA